MVLNALHGDPLPVYGDGQQVRNWIFVEDFARGIGHVLAHGAPGETYNVGGPDEAVNLDVVTRIIALTGASEDLIDYVTDRPGHDRRYSLGSEKVRALGLGAAGPLRRGPRPDRRLVPGQHRVVGPDPLRRLPGVLRAPVRTGARRLAPPPSAPRLVARQVEPSRSNWNVRTRSAPRSRPLTLAVAVSPFTVTASTVRSKSSASLIALSSSCSQLDPAALIWSLSDRARMSSQISSRVAGLARGLQLLDDVGDLLLLAAEVARRRGAARRTRRRARRGRGRGRRVDGACCAQRVVTRIPSRRDA